MIPTQSIASNDFILYIKINDDIGADELVRRLKQLASAFQVGATFL